MQSFILFGYNVFIYNLFSIEARVFCQDSNAGPWVPLGFTCPVVCASVLNAIDKLIMLDYKSSLKEQLGGRQKLNKRLIGYENDFNDDITTNKMGRKSSVADENDKGQTDFDDNLEISKDHQIVDNKAKMYADIEGKVEYDKNNGEESAKFDENAEKYKDFTAIVEYNDNDEHNKQKFNNIDAISKKSKENIKRARNNDNNKEKIANFDANFKINKRNTDQMENNEKNKHENIKFPTDLNQIDNNDIKILENIKHVKGILRRSGKPAINLNKYDLNDKVNDKCWYLEKFKAKLLMGKVVRRKCGRRRSNFDAKFVSVLTNVLNKYVDSVFRFTDEMTEILLENIFGKNTDLRNNIFDVNKLLEYLSKSVDRHRIHSHKDLITLKSTSCLSVAMPGCFCRSGFVESSGQCVKPEDCVTDENNLQYLSRIVVI